MDSGKNLKDYIDDRRQRPQKRLFAECIICALLHSSIFCHEKPKTRCKWRINYFSMRRDYFHQAKKKSKKGITMLFLDFGSAVERKLDITGSKNTEKYFSVDALHRPFQLFEKVSIKSSLLNQIIKMSISAVFNDKDIIRLWGETVYAKETLTNRWLNDVKNIQGIKRQFNFAFSRYSEALYFKNKKSSILLSQKSEIKEALVT